MQPLDFLSRFWLAIVAPWRILFDGIYAAKVRAAEAGAPSLPAAAPAPAPTPTRKPDEPEIAATEPERDLTAALQLLAILQREGRFVDFLQEDVAGASDADIGAAARVVHDGCKRALADYVTIEPVRGEDEGAKVELAAGFDATRIRVTGNVVGEPPYRGTLAHHGWQVPRIRLPELSHGHDPSVLAPAEVEL